MKKTWLTLKALLTVLMALGLPAVGFADTSNFRQFLGKLADNSRASLDVSTRPIFYFEGNEWAAQNVIGLDLFKVVSARDGDLGTLVAQAYYTRIDNVRGHPGFFDDDRDSKLVYRIFNFNFTGLPGKAPNIRVGHMEMAYGLEHPLDTNGTLRQFGLPKNLGIKADWGVSLNQQHQNFEYEFAITTGGGQSIRRNNGSYTFSGRVGSNRDQNLVIGLSGYRSLLGGRIRERFGADLQSYWGKNRLAAEVSLGNTDGEKVRNGVLELGRANNRESFSAYIIANYFSTDTPSRWDTSFTAGMGIRYTPNRNVDLSAQLNSTLSSSSGNKPTNINLQARYRL